MYIINIIILFLIYFQPLICYATGNNFGYISGAPLGSGSSSSFPDITDVNGNVGIGSINPSASLEVFKSSGSNNVANFIGNGGNTVIDQYGNFSSQGANPTSGINGTGVTSLRITKTDGNGLDWRLEQQRNLTNGNLEFNYFQGGNARTAIVLGSNGAGGGNLSVGATTAAPNNGLYVSGQSIFNNNVGIGSSNPGVILDVVGTIRASTGTAGQATCWKSDKSLGQCTTVVGAGGACTCS